MNRPSVFVGDVFTHKTYGEFVIISYSDARNVSIYFSNTGYISRVSVSEIKRMEVRDQSQIRVHGVGINDADYRVIKKFHKGRDSLNEWKCPFWTKWTSMIERCYSGKFKGYEDVTVCEEWLTFSNFKAWMETQDWEGKQLDKDLFGNGTLYSPKTCCFLPEKINRFLIGCNQPLCGQSRHKNGRFQARCINPFTDNADIGRYLGLYDTALDAHLVWKAKKHEYACLLAETEIDQRIISALKRKFL